MCQGRKEMKLTHKILINVLTPLHKKYNVFTFLYILLGSTGNLLGLRIPYYC